MIETSAAEQNARLVTAVAGLSARIDAAQKQLGRMWTFPLLMFATLVGTLATLLTTLLLSN